ncbi:MAG: hypothetical protein ACOYKE_01945 [Ferruginibacter sp.]
MKHFILNAFLTLVSISAFCQTTTKVESVSTCTCAGGLSQCNSSCFFSNCCICFDQNVNEGACGCYFGIAICKSEKKTVASTATSKIGNVQENAKIQFAFDRFAAYISFMKTKRISDLSLDAAFQTFKSKYSKGTGFQSVTPADINPFLTSYDNLINKLTIDQKTVLMNYINEQEKK